MTPLTSPVIAQQAAGGGTGMFTLLMFAALAVLMFLSFRRAKKAQEQQAEMRRSLTPGQEVMMTSGIFGRLVSVDEAAQRATLEVSPGTRMDVHLQGIANVVEPEAAPAVVADGEAGAGSTAAPAVADETDPRTDRA